MDSINVNTNCSLGYFLSQANSNPSEVCNFLINILNENNENWFKSDLDLKKKSFRYLKSIYSDSSFFSSNQKQLINEHAQIYINKILEKCRADINQIISLERDKCLLINTLLKLTKSSEVFLYEFDNGKIEAKFTKEGIYFYVSYDGTVNSNQKIDLTFIENLNAIKLHNFPFSIVLIAGEKNIKNKVAKNQFNEITQKFSSEIHRIEIEKYKGSERFLRDFLRKFSHLESLSFNHCEIKKLPPASCFKNVVSLSIIKCKQLKNISEVKGLNKLEEIHLDWIGNLPLLDCLSHIKDSDNIQIDYDETLILNEMRMLLLNWSRNWFHARSHRVLCSKGIISILKGHLSTIAKSMSKEEWKDFMKVLQKCDSLQMMQFLINSCRFSEGSSRVKLIEIFSNILEFLPEDIDVLDFKQIVEFFELTNEFLPEGIQKDFIKGLIFENKNINDFIDYETIFISDSLKNYFHNFLSKHATLKNSIKHSLKVPTIRQYLAAQQLSFEIPEEVDFTELFKDKQDVDSLIFKHAFKDFFSKDQGKEIVKKLWNDIVEKYPNAYRSAMELFPPEKGDNWKYYPSIFKVKKENNQCFLNIRCTYPSIIQEPLEFIQNYATLLRKHPISNTWISYENQKGIDGGGLKREWLDLLFTATSLKLSLHEGIPSSKIDQTQLYRDIGCVLKEVLRMNKILEEEIENRPDVGNYPIGEVLNEEIIEVLLSLPHESVKSDFQNLVINEEKLLPLIALFGKRNEHFDEFYSSLQDFLNWSGSMDSSDAKKHHQYIKNLFAHHLDAEATLPKYIFELLEGGSIKLDLVVKHLEVFKRIAKEYCIQLKIPQLQTIHSIAQGLNCSQEEWEILTRHGLAKVAKFLLGEFSRKKLKNATTFTANVNEKLKKQFFQWIDKKDSSQLKQFLRIATGSSVVPIKGLEIKESDGCVVGIHTCDFKLEVPYCIDPEMFEVALDNCCTNDSMGYQNV